MRKKYETVDYWLREYHSGKLFREIDDLQMIFMTIEPRWSHSFILIGQGSTRTIFDESMPERYAIKRADIYSKLTSRVNIVRAIRAAEKALPAGDMQRFYNFRYVQGYYRTGAVRHKMGLKPAKYFRVQEKVLQHFYEKMKGKLKKVIVI